MYREYLIKFMEAKHELIKRETGIEYFNEKDRKAILNWDEDKAQAIWEEIWVASLHEGLVGLYSGACPFCIACKIEYDDVTYDIDCFKCAYAKNGHGRCGRVDSDWHRIHSIMNTEDNPTSKFYKDIVLAIDKDILVEE